MLMGVSLVACTKEKKTAPETEGLSLGPDSTALHLAVVTTADCLPFYIAERKGMYRRMQLNLRLHSYRSQMDCDTALFRGIAQVGYADRERMAHQEGAGQIWREWIAFEAAPWWIAVSGKLRVKSVDKLKGRTLAVGRFAASAYYAEQFLSQAGVEMADIYEAQINDLLLRADMLRENQVDAALLPQPYASYARSEGARLLKCEAKSNKNYLAVSHTAEATATRKAQLALLIKGYNMAVDSIRQGGPAYYSDVLQRDFGVSSEVADTIRMDGYLRKL